ncbi:hypothetical protein F4861DRAFT_299324 [Xylaria intraflava]|nr:hypothetical protein F4861DRAFT_299324 [Xylaria intraflava]
MPEYQHFVPQFMLRNFAHKYVESKKSDNDKRKNANKGKKKDKIYRGEFVVNNVNLRADPIVIEETKVSRILGNYDMYQDTAQPTAEQRQIEAILCQLEGHVGTIFRKIIKAFEAGGPSVWVNRDERNAIRKFLFILKYRGTTFHRRFHHESVEKYDSNDKSSLQKYMEENNMKRPLDVWFQGLKTIVNLKMDKDNWEQELLEKMYPQDAMWFISHTEKMYMAICTPSEARSEFVLTDNSYNIFEGPNTFARNPVTGQMEDSGWTNFHEFAPLSPKLMIILRSYILPVPEEDANPRMREAREASRKQAVDDYYGAPRESLLADLPINKPRNSYSEIVDGRVQLLPGEDGIRRKKDKFCFSFFPIGREHVNKINHILLDNAFRCTSIVFGSRDVFFETLEWYMTYPCLLGKVITGDSEDERRKLLVNLAALMKSLGSTKEPVWIEGPSVKDLGKMNPLFFMMNQLQQSLLEAVD